MCAGEKNPFYREKNEIMQRKLRLVQTNRKIQVQFLTNLFWEANAIASAYFIVLLYINDFQLQLHYNRPNMQKSVKR